MAIGSAPPLENFCPLSKQIMTLQNHIWKKKQQKKNKRISLCKWSYDFLICFCLHVVDVQFDFLFFCLHKNTLKRPLWGKKKDNLNIHSFFK